MRVVARASIELARTSRRLWPTAAAAASWPSFSHSHLGHGHRLSRVPVWV